MRLDVQHSLAVTAPSVLSCQWSQTHRPVNPAWQTLACLALCTPSPAPWDRQPTQFKSKTPNGFEIGRLAGQLVAHVLNVSLTNRYEKSCEWSGQVTDPTSPSYWPKIGAGSCPSVPLQPRKHRGWRRCDRPCRADRPPADGRPSNREANIVKQRLCRRHKFLDCNHSPEWEVDISSSIGDGASLAPSPTIQRVSICSIFSNTHDCFSPLWCHHRLSCCTQCRLGSVRSPPSPSWTRTTVHHHHPTASFTIKRGSRQATRRPEAHVSL